MVWDGLCQRSISDLISNKTRELYGQSCQSWLEVGWSGQRGQRFGSARQKMI